MKKFDVYIDHGEGYTRLQCEAETTASLVRTSGGLVEIGTWEHKLLIPLAKISCITIKAVE